MELFKPTIQKVVSRALGKSYVKKLQFLHREYPNFRFVDIFRAVDTWATQKQHLTQIHSEHRESLHQLLHLNPKYPMYIRPSSNMSWIVDEGVEQHYPQDTMWCCAMAENATTADILIRVRFFSPWVKMWLEIAHADLDVASQVADELIDSANRNSIYRGKTLAIHYESDQKDEYGDVDTLRELNIMFRRYDAVPDSDLIIEDESLAVIRRNILDLYSKREILRDFGVPARRGVIFHGPPGTGKSYTCRFICGQTTGVTKIIATGLALQQINSIFLVARLFQPSLIILEDVDLVFASRDINLYSSVMGDLFDHLDGLRAQEDISVILTTNALDRLEEAIKDRPGRISQSIYFAPPNEQLRRLYLERYLKDYDLRHIAMGTLIELSDGATQAFLKEWVIRSVQFALERIPDPVHPLPLSEDDFKHAMDEMRRSGKGSTARILGFGT